MKRKFFKALVATLLSLLLIVSLLVFTHWGNRLLIHGANKLVAGLTIELSQSSVLASPRFTTISYRTKQQQLSLQQVTLEWDWSCVWDSSLCVKEINVDSFSFKQTELSKEPNDTGTIAPINLPFAVSLGKLAVAKFLITLPEQTISIDDLALSFATQKSSINGVTIDIAQLKLNSTSPQQENDQAFVIDQFDPAAFAKTQLPALPLSIDLKRLHVKNFSHQSTGSPVQSLSDIVLSLTANNENVSVSHLSLKHDIGELLVSAKLQNKLYFPHEINLLLKTKQSDDYPDSTIKLTSHGSLEDLKLNLNTQGTVEAAANVTANLATSALPLSIKAAWQDTTLPLAGKLKLNAGSLDLSGDRHNFDYKLTGGAASSTLPAIQIALTGTGSQHNLDVKQGVIDTLAGKIKAAGLINWSDKLSSSVNITLENIQPHTFWPALEGNISGEFASELSLDEHDWMVKINQLDLNGSWLKHPLALSGQVAGNSDITTQYGRWAIESLALKSGSNVLSAQGIITNKINLDSQINAPILSQSIPNITGSVIGAVKLSGDVARPRIIAELMVKGLLAKDYDLAAKSLQFSVDTTLNKQRPVNAQLTLNKLQYQQHQLDVARFALNGDAAKHQLTFTSEGSPLNAQLQLSGTQNGVGWSGDITQASFTTPLKEWRLEEAFTIIADQQQKSISVQPHCWAQSGENSKLCLNQEFILDSQNRRSSVASITLNDFALSQLNKFIKEPITVSGSLSSDIVFELKPGNQIYLHTETSVDQGLATLYYKERTIEHQFTTFTSQAIIDEKLSSVNLYANSKSLGNIGVTLLTNVFAQKPTLTGHIQIDGFKLSPYQALIPDLTRIEGDLNVSTGFTGDLMRPLFFGDVSINDVSIATTRVPTTVDNLNSQLELQGQKALWTSDFQLGGGTGQFNGEVNWHDKLVALLTLQGEALKVAQRKDLYIVFSPQLSVEMTPSITKVRGDVTVNDGLVKIEDLPKSAVSLSDDVKIKSVKKEQIVPLDLNVSLLIDEALKIDAFGLISQLKGKLNLQQTATQPLSGYGDLALVDATYRAMGQNLLINKGQLIFTSVLQNPLLNIEAIRDPTDTENDVVAGLYISGNAKIPKLTIFSKPAMPQQEALSYLLRGKALDAQSGGGSNMAIAMLLNSGIGQSSQMVGNLGDRLGIDQLSLNTSGSGDNTKIEVSGYIAPKLQLRYGVGVFDGTPEVGLRYQLSNKFFVEFVNDTGQALDLLYKFSFD